MKTKRLASHKDSTNSRTDGGKSLVAKRPEAALSSAPEVRTINICHKRDVLALVQVRAAMTIPLKMSEEAELEFVESAEALYQSFGVVDSIDSILATLMCGLSSMTMDAIARGRRSPTLLQREMEHKGATRAALVLAELAKTYDGRRARDKQTVNVGQVNVEAGGQAVVGNVSPAPKIEDPTPPQK